MTISITLDFRLRTPIYAQIVDQIRWQIESGVLKPGDQLPTVRQMATDLRVNFNTVARAYRILDESGVISTQHGRGTYILEEEQEQITAEQRQQLLLSLTESYLKEAARLDFTAEEVRNIIEQKLPSINKENTNRAEHGSDKQP
jgi:GntR family transcriptional regulator